MLTERKETSRQEIEMTCLDMLVPEDHLLRKIDQAIEFEKIYGIVGDLYCRDNGRPSVDPVVLFKIVLIQHLYGIPSLRRTMAEVQMNIAYRWFLGYRISEEIPHFATISYNFRNRFTEGTIEKIFAWILDEIEAAGYLSPEVVYVDGTHIKANANLKKAIKRAIPEAAKSYEEDLAKEISDDREKHGKKPLKEEGRSALPELTGETKISTTDPECGIFHKGEHKKCFAYTAQTVCDDHNYILAAEVFPGNIHDSMMFDAAYEKVTERFPEIKAVAADAAYKTPWICRRIIKDLRIPSMPYTRPKTKDNFFRKHEYVYDEYYDCVICPNDKVLKYSTTNRDGYREYKSDPKECKNCPYLDRCTTNRKFQKTVTIHIWNEYVEQAEEIRHTKFGKETYNRRKETIERVFADAKEKHGMRYTPYRGLTAVRKWVLLKFAAMNLKKMAIRKWWEYRHFFRIVFNVLPIPFMFENNP